MYFARYTPESSNYRFYVCLHVHSWGHILEPILSIKASIKKNSWDCYNGKIQVESDSYCFWSQAAGFPLVGYLLLLKYSTNFDIFNESRSE